jgi:hypothetical protein
MRIFLSVILLVGSALAQGGMGPGPGTVHSTGGGGQTPVFKSLVISSCANGTTCTASSSMNVATGDFIACFAGRGDNTTGAPTSVAATSGAANTMTCSTTVIGNGTVGELVACYVTNATANATATWRVTWPGSSSFPTLTCANYSSMATSSVLDQGPVCTTAGCNASATGVGGRTTANMSATTNPNDLIICSDIADNTATFTSASGFTLRSGTSGSFSGDVSLSDKIVAATGVYPSGAYATVSPTSANYNSLCVAFKGAP